MTAGTASPVSGSLIPMSLTCCLRGFSLTAPRRSGGMLGSPTSPDSTVATKVGLEFPWDRVRMTCRLLSVPGEASFCWTRSRANRPSWAALSVLSVASNACCASLARREASTVAEAMRSCSSPEEIAW